MHVHRHAAFSQFVGKSHGKGHLKRKALKAFVLCEHLLRCAVERDMPLIKHDDAVGEPLP